MTAVGMAILAAVCFGSSDFLGGLAARGATAINVAATIYLVQAIAGLAAAPWFAGNLDRSAGIWGGAAGIGYGAGMWMLYVALKRGPRPLRRH